VSRDAGRTFTEVLPEPTGQPAATGDSALDVASDGRVLVALMEPASFGVVSVCSSADRASTFTCGPVSAPGSNDRPWVLADSPTHSYLSSQVVAANQTVLFQSGDTAATYRATATVDSFLSPGIGPMVLGRSGRLFQPFINLPPQGGSNDGPTGTGVSELNAPLAVYEWDRSTPAAPATILPSPFLSSSGVASLASTSDGTLYLVAEGVSRRATDGTVLGKSIQIARSSNDGRSWTVLPALPGTSHGTVAFSWITAGKNGHVGVISYRTPAGSRADSSTGTWDVVWAETWNAHARTPSWRTTVLERHAHKGNICNTGGCPGSGRFAGDFINAWMDRHDHPHLVWVRDTSTATQVRYTTSRQPGSL
jgi:hypothetical protein